VNDLVIQRRELTLAVVGIGISMVGIAISLHPFEVSLLVFWMLIGVVVLGAVSMCSVSLGRFRRSRRPRPRLVASECQRVSDTIAALVSEQWRKRPRAKPFVGVNEESLARWGEETIERYNQELRMWAQRVYDDAVACGVISDSSGLLVERPQAAQLPSLRDLFREAADTLERM